MDISHRSLEDTGLVLIQLRGRLDTKASKHVRTMLQTLLEQGHHKLILDLSQVPFIDSSGLAALVSGLRLARELEGHVTLYGIQPQARTVFRLTMLDRIFDIHPSLDDAKRSLR